MITFALSRSAGDPRLLYAGAEGYGMTPEHWDLIDKELGLDKPIVVQYFVWMGDILRGDFGYTVGEWYHGDKQTAYLELGFDPAKWLNLRLEYSYNLFELPELDFDAHIASGRLRINFTPDMGWSHLVQYDSVSESIGYNTRYFWEFQPGKKFHVVLRQNYGDDDRLFSLRESEFVLKAVATFRL